MIRKLFVLALAAVAATACQTTGSKSTRTASSAPQRTDAAQSSARADAGSPTAGGTRTQPGEVSGSVGTSDSGAQASAGGSMSSGTYGSAGTSSSGELRGHPTDQIVAGRVQKMSDDSITIAAQDGTSKQLKVSEATLVEIDGRQAKATDIREGQDVRASYNDVSGEDVAVRIVSGAMGSSGSSWGSGSSGTGSSSTGTANEPPPTAGSSKSDVTNTPSDVSRGSTTGVEKPGKTPQDKDATKQR
jgi:hypothetical protein